MSIYPIHSFETAPEASRPALQGLQQALGLVPNLAATMATSPTLINGFVGVFGRFAQGSFTGAERQVLLLSNAVGKPLPVGGGLSLHRRAEGGGGGR